MLALSIRQPYAELILRGIKTAEIRSRATKVVGRRFYIYASKKCAAGSGQWAVKTADNVVVPNEPLPEWMVELARQIRLLPADLELPTGVIVGSAVIERVEQINDERGTMNEEVRFGVSVHRSSLIVPRFRWHLTEVQRAKRLRKPRGHPQPVWFTPF